MKFFSFATLVVVAFFMECAAVARELVPDESYAILNVTYVNNDDEPHARKKLTFVGENNPKNKIVVKTDKDGEATFKIPRGDKYIVLCESLTGPFECGETPYVSLTATSGGLTVVFDDTRVELKGITFAENSAEFDRRGTKTLDAAIAGLKMNPGAKVEIEGHACMEGDDLDEQILSAERAYSVRKYMVEHGIDENRVTATGYGSSQPRKDYSTMAGRRANRRVEIRVLNPDEVEVSEE